MVQILSMLLQHFHPQYSFLKDLLLHIYLCFTSRYSKWISRKTVMTGTPKRVHMYFFPLKQYDPPLSFYFPTLRCRVNAALTIQLFSQLFHYINMWTFNRIVLEPDLKLCTRLWGHCLRMRLSFIEAWAERQGLELAADCHLARVVQV